VLLSLLIATPGHATPLAVSTIYIEPTGYEDTSTHEWKGSFWVITATTDTKESFVFYQFNETEASSFGQNKIDNKAIVPIATIKITITPRQPYWERPLRAEDPWMVYPKTYGTYRNYITKLPSKIEETYVEALYAEVLSCGVDDLWTRHTPFDVTVEKIGTNPFTQTERVDTIGGTEILVLTNPADSSEKLMISNLGQLGTGYGQPSIDEIIIFEKGTESIAFDRTKVENAIKYGRNLDTGGVLSDESYAFYWFGGGSTYLAPSSHEEVRWYFDDKSPAHAVYIGALEYRKLVEDSDFPGSYRDDGPNFWDERALPIAADIWDDNVATNPIGLSLINYLKQKIKGEVDLNKSWGQGWTITEGNKLRIYMPSGAASSLITIKISTELADSVVYQPIVGNGKIEQAFWDSTKTTKSLIKDNETAVLKVKQYASKTSKLTVTPSIPANVPVSVSPLMDSAIVDPNAVHTFQFEIRNLGTQVNQSSTVTFTITNDLGTVTDTATLDFDLIVIENPQPNPQPKDTGLEGDPLWIWLVAVVSITVATASVYGVYTYRSSRKRTLGKKEQNQ
jgi:hypothetical protein